MSLKNDHLYFLAIAPPNDVSGQITAFKKHIQSEYGSHHALRSPPHITLHMPFRWRLQRKEQLLQQLSLITENQKPFHVALSGFDTFEPRVIFVNVLQSIALQRCFENVKKAMRSLNILNAQYKDRPFHPHITIAFGDLKKAQFYKAREVYKHQTYQAHFLAEELILFRHEADSKEQQRWFVDHRFKMKG